MEGWGWDGRGWDGMGGEGRGVKMLHTYRHTYRHTDRHTDRASDEAGPRGAFAPNKGKLNFTRNDKYRLPQPAGRPEQDVHAAPNLPKLHLAQPGPKFPPHVAQQEQPRAAQQNQAQRGRTRGNKLGNSDL